MPWAVARKRVGKHSAGTMNVVVLGPKFEKKLHRQNKAKSAWAPRLSQAKPIIQKRMSKIANPPIWSGFLPKRSIVAHAKIKPGINPPNDKITLPQPVLTSLTDQ